MKYLAIVVSLSILVVCEANLPGLPFLQRVQERLVQKRLLEDDVAKAYAEFQRRVQQECYPLATACSTKCVNEPVACSECERQMSKCVQRLTVEIYAAHNLVSPYGKRESNFNYGAKVPEQKEATRGLTQQELDEKIMEKCRKPATDKYYECRETGKSEDDCTAIIIPYLEDCTAKIIKQE